MKEELKVVWNGLKVAKKYGVASAWKRIENRRFHASPDLEAIKKVHIVSEEELNRQREYKFRRGVKFSIITPLFNTPEKYLIQLLDSLREQTYAKWELCLADGSDEQHQYVGEICRNYHEKDKRIVYKTLTENKGISENTNECIKMATGEYIALLDHDDLLHPAALFEVMSVVEKENADFIYTDEVKFSEHIGNIDSASLFNFKPGFGKYDLRSHNYICHFTVFSKKLLEGEKRLYRAEFDGSQDHDMVLRLTEKADHIVHIPKVLYYWRLHSNSVSLDLGSKSYAVDAAIRAVTAQLEREGEKGTVGSNLPFQTIYKIRYEIKGKPKVSVVLHNSINIREIRESIEKIVEKTSYRPLEILYLGEEKISIENRLDIEIKNISIKDIRNMSRGSVWNCMIGEAEGDYIVLNDVRSVPVNREWLDEMIMLGQKADVCAVGPKILYKDQTIAYAGGALWQTEKSKVKMIGSHDTVSDIGYEAILCHVRNTTFTLAANMLFSKITWAEAGGFKENGSGYEDIEFCLSGLNKGKNNVWTCFSTILFEGEKIFSVESEEKVKNFEEKYEKSFLEEKYYHPNWEIMGLV